jgi:hypothetical protein
MTWSFRRGQSSRQAFIIYHILILPSYNKLECTDTTALISGRLRILQGDKNVTFCPRHPSAIHSLHTLRQSPTRIEARGRSTSLKYDLNRRAHQQHCQLHQIGNAHVHDFSSGLKAHAQAASPAYFRHPSGTEYRS